MDREPLKELQRPLKDRYREDPGAARVTLSAEGTLAVSRDAAVGFEDIGVSFELETDANPEDVETLLRLTERFCVVGQTLSRPPTLTFQTA